LEAIYTERELNLARLAAYIDGEGTIDLQRSSQGEGRAPSYKLRVVIANTDIRLLAWCKINFGGSVRMNRKGEETRLPAYIWEMSGARQCVSLLRELLPFFVIKREQAEIGIVFGKTFSPSNRDPRGLGDAVRAERDELRGQIFEMRSTKKSANLKEHTA